MHEIVKFIKSGFKLLFVVSIKPWNQIIFKFCTSDDALRPIDSDSRMRSENIEKASRTI